MRPANTRVRAGNDNCFSFKPERPNIRSVGVLDAWLNSRGCAGYARPERRSFDRTSLRQLIMNLRVSLNTCYAGKSSQRVGGFSVSLHPNCIHNIKGAVLDVTVSQPLKDRRLRAMRRLQ